MGWAARANGSDEIAKANNYQKPRIVTIGRRRNLRQMLQHARVQSLLLRKKGAA